MPLRFDGSRLSKSLSTSAAGSIRVEIQDAGARPIPGYSLSESHETFGDDLDRIVAWTGGPEVSRLAGETVRLPFLIKDADLFAVQFRDAEP